MKRLLTLYLVLAGLLAHLAAGIALWHFGPQRTLQTATTALQYARLRLLHGLSTPAALPGPGDWPAQGPDADLGLAAQAYTAAGRPLGPEAGDFVPPGRVVAVDTTTRLLQAIAGARPGDTIELAAGEYRVRKRKINVGRPGRRDRPIHLRAARHGSVRILLDSLEGFHVRAPFWVFDNLVIRGACAAHADCEHAFHVTGRARGFVLRNSTVEDFNAAIKANGVGRGDRAVYPDHGLVYRSLVRNSSARRTSASVTHIDVVGADGWVVARNILADAAKLQGNRVSYLAFFKGGGRNGVMAQNLAVCTDRVRDESVRVGLSLGGGGTGKGYCRRGCGAEHSAGVIRYNLIVNCTGDAGIHLRRAAGSQVHNNLLHRTGGISAQFAQTSGQVFNNLGDTGVALRRGATLEAFDNLQLAPCDGLRRTLGLDCIDSVLSAPDRGDFNPIDSTRLRARGAAVAGADDLCARAAAGVGRDIGPWHLAAGPPDCLPAATLNAAHIRLPSR